MSKIAVEEGLRPFQEALSRAGFEVVEVREPEQLYRSDSRALVISGLDNDFMGMTSGGERPVISAAGRTPEEIVEEVRRHVGGPGR